MFSIALTYDEHVKRYSVTPTQPSGWELVLTEDLTRTKHLHFDDWHRVERALALLKREILDLSAKGWHVEP